MFRYPKLWTQCLCLTSIISNIFLIIFFIISALAIHFVYNKYPRNITDDFFPLSNNNNKKNNNKTLCGVYVTFTLCLPLLDLVQFVLDIASFNWTECHNYMTISIIVSLLIFPYSIYLKYKEMMYTISNRQQQRCGMQITIFWILVFVLQNLAFLHLRIPNTIAVIIFILRYICCLIMVTLTLTIPRIMKPRSSELSVYLYGDQKSHETYDAKPGSTWIYVWRKCRIIAPFFWPRRNWWLQLQAILCVVLLILGRINNLYVPIYNKLVVDSMETAPYRFRVDLVVIYVILKTCQGGGPDGMGILNNVRSLLWVRVQQYTTRNIRITLLRHLHDLSLRWHFSRKTGEVLRLMDRGTDSINNILNYLVFIIVPTIFDIIIAIVYFAMQFDMWFGLIILFTMLFYGIATVTITEWRTKFKRHMNVADNATRAQSVDSLLNFETVKYYSGEEFEVEAFHDTVEKFQTQEWKVNITLNGLKTVQNIIVNIGLLIGSLLCVYLVVETETLTVGDYVLFSTYVLQLCVPLNSFGKYYITIQNALVDMENMLDLLHEKVEVTDKPTCKPMVVTKGGIEFKNVSFGYDHSRTVLKDITFEVPPTKTVALVGPSGSGKSTIIRLLFRFYDVTEGAILIDDQNISDVSVDSLRKAIGVVPQDTVLFNNTIKYNIKYGRLGASDSDIIEAARQADIHESILKLPQGYETKVGERGLRLSGGEKQRVAIARTLLKSPKIVVLDEATSALDTKTERHIQSALRLVCKDRTTVVVAHRLSTIIHADEILVLKNGTIVERGTHDSLINLDGIYNSMWLQQLETEEDCGEHDTHI